MKTRNFRKSKRKELHEGVTVLNAQIAELDWGWSKDMKQVKNSNTQLKNGIKVQLFTDIVKLVELSYFFIVFMNTSRIKLRLEVLSVTKTWIEILVVVQHQQRAFKRQPCNAATTELKIYALKS